MQIVLDLEQVCSARTLKYINPSGTPEGEKSSGVYIVCVIYVCQVEQLCFKQQLFCIGEFNSFTEVPVAHRHTEQEL